MSYIERNVMSSVAMVYLLRKATGSFALKLYALVVSAVGIVAFVSVNNVLQNFMQVAQQGPANILGYTVAAVAGTTLLVQLALALGMFAAGSLLLDAFRAAPTRFQYR